MYKMIFTVLGLTVGILASNYTEGIKIKLGVVLCDQSIVKVSMTFKTNCSNKAWFRDRDRFYFNFSRFVFHLGSNNW